MSIKGKLVGNEMGNAFFNDERLNQNFSEGESCFGW